jgi:autotransporter family porin
VLLEPQVQFIYTDYRSGSHTERNGTVIQDSSSGGWTTRLGTRLYHTPAPGIAPDWLPFVERNWWHNGSGNAMAFNSTVIAQDGPTDRVEVKAGAQVQVAQRWRMWGHIGYQYGNGGFESVTGLLGVRYLW